MWTSPFGFPITNGVSARLNLVQDLQREIVRAGDPHRAELRVEARRELTAGEYAAADAVLRFEHDDLVPLVLQLVGGDEPGKAGAEHDDPLARPATAIQPVADDPKSLLSHARMIEDRPPSISSRPD